MDPSRREIPMSVASLLNCVVRPIISPPTYIVEPSRQGGMCAYIVDHCGMLSLNVIVTIKRLHAACSYVISISSLIIYSADIGILPYCNKLYRARVKHHVSVFKPCISEWGYKDVETDFKRGRADMSVNLLTRGILFDGFIDDDKVFISVSISFRLIRSQHTHVNEERCWQRYKKTVSKLIGTDMAHEHWNK